jgi:hypothetical protein
VMGGRLASPVRFRGPTAVGSAPGVSCRVDRLAAEARAHNLLGEVCLLVVALAAVAAARPGASLAALAGRTLL